MNKWKKICYGCLPFLAAIMLMYAATFLFLIGISLIWGDSALIEIGADSQIWANCLVYIVFLIVFGLWYKRVFGNVENKKLSRPKGLSPMLLLNSIVLGISLQCFCSYALNVILPLFPKTYEHYKLLMEQMGTGQGIVPLIYMGLLAPVAEELIFRGLILGYEERELPFFWANLIQAFLFGLYHQNLVQFVYAFFVGLLLGNLYRQFRSLKLVMLIHGVINISGNILALFDLLLKKQYDMLAGLFVSFLFLCGTLLVLKVESCENEKGV